MDKKHFLDAFAIDLVTNSRELILLFKLAMRDTLLDLVKPETGTPPKIYQIGKVNNGFLLILFD